MYFLLKIVGFPACYVSLPKGICNILQVGVVSWRCFFQYAEGSDSNFVIRDELCQHLGGNFNEIHKEGRFIPH